MSLTAGAQVRLARGPEVHSLIEWAAQFDPGSCVVIDRLTTGKWRRGGIWLAEDESGGLRGLVLIDRVCRDRWVAYPLLADTGAAAALAPVIDAGRAWGVEGLDQHVVPFIGRLSRATGEPRVRTFVQVNYDSIRDPGLTSALDSAFGTVDDRPRPGSLDDLDGLVELYAGYEIQRIPTLRRLRSHLAGILARLPVVVAEEDGRLVGAMYAEAMSARTILWTDATVLPEYRGRRLSLAILRAGIDASTARGRGCAGTQQPTNPLRIPASLGDSLGYEPDGLSTVFVRLSAPVRFRGQNRLRDMLERAEGRRTPRG